MTASQKAWSPVRWAKNGGVQIAYDRFLAAPADGEPLLLLMGLGTSRRWWPDGFCAALAAHGFAVARYDQRDAGESTHLQDAPARNPIAALTGKRREIYTAEDMADDAIAVMDALGWESAHLLGASLGGAAAQRVALRHPDRVRTLTSSSAVPGDMAGVRTLRYIRLGTLAKLARLKFPDTREGDVEAGVALARMLASPARPFDEQAVRARIESSPDPGVRDQKAQSRQIGARWHGPPVSSLRTPTLVLHGEDDPLIRPAAARRIATTVAGSSLAILPGVGHDLPEHAWPDVADRVRRHAGLGQRRTAHRA
ncbi:alpha/beta hydrolase [Actinomadura vinacea]|uniref:Alpha/beta hydrolase n=1 Tax=Actinomadura vinacea TaxID=115336 RepID=A0ABP5VEZ1_9ACTN